MTISAHSINSFPLFLGKIDIAYFRTLYSDACEKLLQLCDSWERKAVILEQKDDSGIPDMEEGNYFFCLIDSQ